MVCRDYLADNSSEWSKCKCFLYDAHDPTSCSMGATYMWSNFGAGADPWLWMCFFTAVWYSVSLHRVRNGAVKQVSVLSVLGKDPVLGWVVGASLWLMFAIYFVMRFVFALVPKKTSRLVNVGMSPVFFVALWAFCVAMSNAWWKFQFELHRAEYGDELAVPQPGLLRRSATLLLSARSSGPVCTAGRWLAAAIEFCAVVCCIIFIVTGIVLASVKSQRADESSTHFVYLIVSIIFNSLVLAFMLDTSIAMIAHQLGGLKPYLRRAGGVAARYTKGINQRPLEKRDTVFLFHLMLTELMVTSMVLRQLSGWCPYIDYDKDLYHGGDPAEAAGADIAIFVLLFYSGLYFLFQGFRPTEEYWERADFNMSPQERSSQQLGMYPAAHSDRVWSAMLSSSIVLIMGITIAYIDTMYKYDAKMVGRILYFVGFLIQLQAFEDRKLFLIVLDNRNKSWAIAALRVTAATLALFVLTVYIVVASYWDREPEALKGAAVKPPPLDKLIFFSGLITWFVKLVVVAAYESSVRKLDLARHEQQQQQQQQPRHQQRGQQGGQQQGQQQGQQELGAEGASGELTIKDGRQANVGQADEHNELATMGVGSGKSAAQVVLTRATKLVVALSAFAFLVAEVFKTWVFFAIVWNAISLVMFLGCVGSMMGLLLKEKVMHDEQHEPVIKAIKSQTSLPTAQEEQVQRAAHHSFGWKRELAVFAIQLCVVVVVYFVTQMFLFIETQAPYYQKQIMVWGHRGAWTDGVCENCADAFTFAKSKGYHGVEFDMRLTKDNVLAVMHDTTLDRTTNGTGPIKEIMLGDLQKLSLRKEGSDAFADHELNHPYTMDEVIEVCLERNAMMNIEAKQDANMTVIPNDLNAVSRHNATQMAFLSTGDLKFQHQLMHMEPEVSLERDFLLHTSAMAQTVPPNVNIYGISAELLLFNTWVISVAHQADQMLLVYFLAIETPAMINYFIALGADGFLLNNPDHCVAAGVCTPAMNFTIPRTIQPWPGPGAYSW